MTYHQEREQRARDALAPQLQAGSVPAMREGQRIGALARDSLAGLERERLLEAELASLGGELKASNLARHSLEAELVSCRDSTFVITDEAVVVIDHEWLTSAVEGEERSYERLKAELAATQKMVAFLNNELADRDAAWPGATAALAAAEAPQ